MTLQSRLVRMDPVAASATTGEVDPASPPSPSSGTMLASKAAPASWPSALVPTATELRPMPPQPVTRTSKPVSVRRRGGVIAESEKSVRHIQGHLRTRSASNDSNEGKQSQGRVHRVLIHPSCPLP